MVTPPCSIFKALALTLTANSILCRHCILLDLKLPGMSGLELLRWLRQQKNFRRIPVLVLTSENDPALWKRLMTLERIRTS